MSGRTERRSREQPVVNPPAVDGRVPPHDLEAEAAVLSASMLRGEIVDELVDLRPEHFYAEAHRRIFEACLDLRDTGKPVDLVQVGTWLRDRQRLAQVGGVAYLTQVCDAAPVVANVVAYADTVREKYRVRQVILACQRIAAEGYGDYGNAEEYFDEAERAVQAARGERRGRSELEPIGPSIRAVFDDVEKKAKGVGEVATQTGFRDLDEKTGGLFDGDLTVVGGRPGMGKTAFIVNGAEKIAKQPHTAVAIFSVEMPKKQLAARAVTSSALVNLLSLRTGRLSPEDWGRLTVSASALYQAPIWVDETPRIAATEIAAKVRRLKSQLARTGEGDQKGKTKLKVVYVDFLQLMKKRNPDDVVRSIGENAEAMKALAKEEQLHVVLLSSLNRGVETRSDKRPMMNDLRESGEIESHADNIVMLYRDEAYNEHTKEPGIVELILAKQRNGPTCTVKLGFLKESTTFIDAEREFGEDTRSRYEPSHYRD